MFIDFLVRGLIENALCRQISSAANLLRKHCIKRTFYIPVFYTDVQSVREVSTHLTPSAVTFVLLRSKLYSLGIPEFFNSTIDSSLTPLLEEMSKISKLWCHWNKKRCKQVDVETEVILGKLYNQLKTKLVKLSEDEEISERVERIGSNCSGFTLPRSVIGPEISHFPPANRDLSRIDRFREQVFSLGYGRSLWILWFWFTTLRRKVFHR